MYSIPAGVVSGISLELNILSNIDKNTSDKDKTFSNCFYCTFTSLKTVAYQNLQTEFILPYLY